MAYYKTHGHSVGCYGKHNTTPTYNSWMAMKQRCLNPNNPGFKNYGGRGIKICDRWICSFENFLADMGVSPGSGYSIERINNDGNYCPENCKWGTRLEQANNSRQVKMITFHGQTMRLSDWSKKLGINISTLSVRLKRHSVERAFTQPKGSGNFGKLYANL